MVAQDSLLVTLVKLVDRLPMPAFPLQRGRGHPKFYTDRLFLKALVIMIDLIQPWATCGRAVAIDSTTLQARGGVWHHKHREQGLVPHTSIDTQAHWTKSGWHGWVYGWKLHVSVVAAVWFPLAAVLTPANVADSDPAPELLREVPAEVRFVLGDRHYNTPDLHEDRDHANRLLVTTKYGRYPHTDAGVEVRRIFHKLRSMARENFNDTSKASLMDMDKFPPKAGSRPNASR